MEKKSLKSVNISKNLFQLCMNNSIKFHRPLVLEVFFHYSLEKILLYSAKSFHCFLFSYRFHYSRQEFHFIKLCCIKKWKCFSQNWLFVKHISRIKRYRQQLKWNLNRFKKRNMIRFKLREKFNITKLNVMTMLFFTFNCENCLYERNIYERPKVFYEK